MRRTDIPYVGGFVSAAWYAWWLEQREKKYHADVTWKNVTGGIALTGFWVAVRVLQGAPPLHGWGWQLIRNPTTRGAVWAWLVMLRMFCTTAVPVVGWELLAKGNRWRVLLAYWRESHAIQASTAWEQGE